MKKLIVSLFVFLHASSAMAAFAIDPEKGKTYPVIGSSGGSGDVEAVGDCASGACFNGTSGTVLTFNNAGGDKTLDYDGTDFLFNAPLSITGALDASGTIQSGSGNITITDSTGNLDGTKVANADLGDIAVSAGAWAVEDDSHAHTTTSLSGIDIGDDTNLAGTLNEITLTGDTLSAAAAMTRDAEWDTEGEVQTAWGAVNILLETEIDASSELRAIMDDESGTGALLFADGAIGAATATTASADDNDTSVATTAYVQTEINAMGGRSLSAASGSMDADVELYTHTLCYRLPASPVAGDDDKSIWINNTANQFTITKLWCESDQTVNAMLQVDDGTPADVDSVDLACTSTPATDTSLNGDATIAAGDRIDLDVASVSGTPTWCTICFTGTWDD